MDFLGGSTETASSGPTELSQTDLAGVVATVGPLACLWLVLCSDLLCCAYSTPAVTRS